MRDKFYSFYGLVALVVYARAHFRALLRERTIFQGLCIGYISAIDF